MKNTIAIILAALAITGSLIVAFIAGEQTAEAVNDNIYTKTAQVYDINEETNIITLEDFHGNLWQYRGIEGWEEINALCVIIFDNNKTEEITDDIIIRVDPQGVTDPDGWIER